MTTILNEMQVDKFRALGKAAKALASEYQQGKGPDPVSGSTFKNGVPMCTWGQVVAKAGWTPDKNFTSGNNLDVLGKYIGNTGVASQAKGESVVPGLFADKKITYDISKIHQLASQIMSANDPAPTAALRKERTWKLLDELGNEIDKQFGETDVTFNSFEAAADQYLQEMIGVTVIE